MPAARNASGRFASATVVVILAVVASLVVHLFGPVTHAGSHLDVGSAAFPESGALASPEFGESDEDRVVRAAHGSGHSHSQAAGVGSVDQRFSPGDVSHPDAGCGSVIRPSGPLLVQPLLDCTMGEWQPRIDEASPPMASVAAAMGRAAPQLRTPGVQRR